MFHRERIILLLLLLAAAAIMLTGITWGLPSREADRFLFGQRQPWSGQRVQELAGERPRDPAVAADVDHSPLPRDRIVPLSQSDQDRAALVRRYRLYTYQPDEMQTMMSLAEMRPGALDFDPRMYKYGGLWIYPVAALAGAASAAGVATLSSDPAYYLEHPEQFARFYIVARLYSALWGLVGVWVVFRLARDLSGRLWPAAGAAAIFMLMPVVVSMAHEAKPHLAGAVLMLLAVWAAVRWVQRGTRAWALITGALCGAAFGMVLSSLWAFAVPVVMMMLRPIDWRQRLGAAGLALAAGVAVYFLTNPYVARNMLFNPQVVRSNIENSVEFYSFDNLGAGFLNAMRLVGAGASWGVVAGAVVGLLAALWAWRRGGAQAPAGDWPAARAHLLLLGTPAALVFMQFGALAAGWPGEYARFGVYLCAVLAVVVPAGLAQLPHRLLGGVALAAVLLWASWAGGLYLRTFVRDAAAVTSRMELAAQLEALRHQGHRTLGLLAEPAPYSAPPFDLFEWEVLLLPADYQPGREEPVADVILRPVDVRLPLDATAGRHYRLLHPPMGPLERFGQPIIPWADKPFEVLVRRPDAP